MMESMYPKCGKCNEGTLLPFFDRNGINIYGCTKCGAMLHPIMYLKNGTEIHCMPGFTPAGPGVGEIKAEY